MTGSSVIRMPPRSSSRHTPRICRGAAVEHSKSFQDLIDPEILIDRFSIAALAGNKDDHERRAHGQRGMEDLLWLGYDVCHEEMVP
jgi:hypothetical protein